MSTDIAIIRTSSTAHSSTSVPLWAATNDNHSKTSVFLNTVVAEADSKVHAYIRAYHALVPEGTAEEVGVEEREWDSIVNKPHVREALRRMAAEARQQYFAGETEEGGFAVE